MTEPSVRTEEMLALYALGVPLGAITSHYGIRTKTLQKRAQYHKVRRPSREDQAMLARVSRAERIRRHAAEYPSVSLFSQMEEAA